MAEKGRWEVVQVWKNHPQTTVRCTECKTWQPIYHHDEWPYCPFCGMPMEPGAWDPNGLLKLEALELRKEAKMDGGAEDA